ncbi:hypothetical protein B0H14DRAFT_3150721 [Mycena olivaceomarginata]|nr:hypothetical protein B0H14DRAFT_3150721 [Mycena olivaceomarginata]
MFLILKFHLPAHIEMDSEMPECSWADTNPLVRSTKEMGPGFRQDTIDDHFNDWNHKKIIVLGGKGGTRNDEDEGGIGGHERVVVTGGGKEMDSAPYPFETMHKDKHLAKVRAELAVETVAREAVGKEDTGAIKGDMHITELIAVGLQLEDQQRVLAFNIMATGLCPTDGQCRTMIECTSKLWRKIVAWVEGQQRFFPALATVWQHEDEEHVHAAEEQSVPRLQVSDIPLWLPSAVATTPVPDMEGVMEPEYQLRMGQANKVLHKTHLYKLKDMHSRGVWANMRSGDKIAALNQQVHPSFAIQSTRRKGVERELSWIWVNRGEQWELGDNRCASSGPRRARHAMRWAEEVDLLEEEMQHCWRLSGESEIRARDKFLVWRAEWWKAKVDRQRLSDRPQLEEETMYALRQAGEVVDGAMDSDEEGSNGSDMGSEEEDEPISSLRSGRSNRHMWTSKGHSDIDCTSHILAKGVAYVIGTQGAK